MDVLLKRFDKMFGKLPDAGHREIDSLKTYAMKRLPEGLDYGSSVRLYTDEWKAVRDEHSVSEHVRKHFRVRKPFAVQLTEDFAKDPPGPNMNTAGTVCEWGFRVVLRLAGTGSTRVYASGSLVYKGPPSPELSLMCVVDNRQVTWKELEGQVRRRGPTAIHLLNKKQRTILRRHWPELMQKHYDIWDHASEKQIEGALEEREGSYGVPFPLK